MIKRELTLPVSPFINLDTDDHHPVSSFIYPSDINLNKTINKVVKLNAITLKWTLRSLILCILGGGGNLEILRQSSVVIILKQIFSMWGYKRRN